MYCVERYLRLAVEYLTQLFVLLAVIFLCGSVIAQTMSEKMSSSRSNSNKSGSELATGETQGATDTAMYSLTLDTVSGYPGVEVGYEIFLSNMAPVGSFNLLINYDKSILTPSGITTENTLSADFEYFNYVLDEDGIAGNIRIEGIVDLSEGGTTPPLEAGDGAVVGLKFRIISDISYSGYSIPVRFVFLDELTRDDNTLTDENGIKIEQSAIDYFDGYVYILEIGEVNIGDINLNGLAYEISDAIYFTNFYMNPNTYPMDPLQLANSDINGDGIVASVADLVALIDIIVSGQVPNGKSTEITSPEASFSYNENSTGVSFGYEAGFDIGGVFMTLNIAHDVNPGDIICPFDEMSLEFRQDGDELRVLIYSLEGFDMPSGEQTFLSIEGVFDNTVTSVELASADGEYVNLNHAGEAELPEKFELLQNYPNPFNPETRIGFALPENSHVTLTIYNVLGREVKILVDENLSAGPYDITWNGTSVSGQSVASGVYYYRLQTDLGSMCRKMILLK